MTFKAIFTTDDLLSFFETGDIDTNQVKSFADKHGVQIQSVTKRMNKLPQFQKLGRVVGILQHKKYIKHS